MCLISVIHICTVFVLNFYLGFDERRFLFVILKRYKRLPRIMPKIFLLDNNVHEINYNKNINEIIIILLIFSTKPKQ